MAPLATQGDPAPPCPPAPERAPCPREGQGFLARFWRCFRTGQRPTQSSETIRDDSVDTAEAPVERAQLRNGRRHGRHASRHATFSRAPPVDVIVRNFAGEVIAEMSLPKDVDLALLEYSVRSRAALDLDSIIDLVAAADGQLLRDQGSCPLSRFEHGPVELTCYNWGSASVSVIHLDCRTKHSWWGTAFSEETSTVIGIPFSSPVILSFNSETGEFRECDVPGGGHRSGWAGGAMAAGSLWAMPYNASRVLRFDPRSFTAEFVGPHMGTGKQLFYGSVVVPSGRVIGIPHDAHSVLEVDPSEKTVRRFGDLRNEPRCSWRSGCLGGDGMVYGIPCSGNRVLRIDPTTKAISLFGNVSAEPEKWQQGVTGPDGNVYGIPRNAHRILKISVADGSVSEVGPDLGDAKKKYEGGCLGPDGRIYCIPFNESQVLRFDVWTGVACRIGRKYFPGQCCRWVDGVLVDRTIYSMPVSCGHMLRVDW